MSKLVSTPDGDRMVRVIDCHHHIGLSTDGGWRQPEWRREDLRGRSAYMRANDIDAFVAAPGHTICLEQSTRAWSEANDMVAAYVAEAGPVAAGLLTTVHAPDVAGSQAELARCFDELGSAGLILHHRLAGMSVNDRRTDALLEVVEDRGGVACIHILAESSLEAPWRLFALARRHPSIRILGLDAFSSAEQAEYLCEVAGDHPNVSFDTGCLISVAHFLPEFLERHGSGRLVLGTDRYSGQTLTYHSRTAFPVHEISAMQLPADDVENIFHRNIERLLQRRPT